MRITLSMSPTFHDPENDIYHKATASIEFDPDEYSQEEAEKSLIINYFRAVKMERDAVLTIRNEKPKVSAKKFMDSIRKEVDKDLSKKKGKKHE